MAGPIRLRRKWIRPPGRRIRPADGHIGRGKLAAVVAPGSLRRRRRWKRGELRAGEPVRRSGNISAELAVTATTVVPTLGDGIDGYWPAGDNSRLVVRSAGGVHPSQRRRRAAVARELGARWPDPLPCPDPAPWRRLLLRWRGGGVWLRGGIEEANSRVVVTANATAVVVAAVVCRYARRGVFTATGG